MPPPHSIRMLADDLTGALDTAAEFASTPAPVPAFWHGGLPVTLPPTAALDTGTRELDDAAACAIVHRLATELAPAAVAYKKVDSLMRGPTIAELATCFAIGAWRAAVFAPAFPYQGRITSGGRQYARAADGAWTPAGPDLVAALRALGVAAQPGRPGALPPGISVFDATTEADLDAVVAGAAGDGILWCGTAGLARALAQARGFIDPAASPRLPQPILGLFGSDQPVTAAQLAACGPHWAPLMHDDPTGPAQVEARLNAAGMALVSLDLPPGLTRDAAAERIAKGMHALCEALPSPPGTLLVAGGETLRGLCLALGAASLHVQGRIIPGLPRSVLHGGRWTGVTVVSKSGAFGPPDLLRRLLEQNGFTLGEHQ